MHARSKTCCEASAFSRERLPSAASFYANELGKLSRPSRGWATARCPFHQPDKRPSLSVNLTGGGFLCFSCQARGGSIIDFLMLRDRVDFMTAAKRLGAWRDLTESERSLLAEQRRERNRAKQAAIDSVRAEHELRMRYRSEIHALEAARRDATGQLGNPEKSAADRENCWKLLALIQDELRECLATYYLLSFGTCAERQEFIENPEWRDHAIRGVLDHGFVSDDSGHVMEVSLP